MDASASGTETLWNRKTRRNGESGFKGSRVAMVLIKLARIRDRREIKRSMERKPSGLRKNKTKDDNAGGCLGQVYTAHFSILRQKYYKFESICCKSWRLSLPHRESGRSPSFLGSILWSPRTL